jgi:hypothetical protein
VEPAKIAGPVFDQAIGTFAPRLDGKVVPGQRSDHPSDLLKM